MWRFCPALLLRFFLAGVLAAVVAAASFPFVYAHRARLVVALRKGMPTTMQGFYPAEKSPTGVTFAWTEPRARLRLEGLDRSVDWIFATRVVIWRPSGVPLPEVRVSVDGARRLVQRATRDFEHLRVTVPARRGSEGVVIEIAVHPAFSPGPQDPRLLGIAVDELRLEPTAAHIRPPRRAWLGSVATAGVLGAAFAAVGVPPLLAAAAAAPLIAAQELLATERFAPYLGYTSRTALLALVVAIGLVVSIRIIERARGASLSRYGRFVALYCAGALFVRMLVLLHPDMPVGDALFHAHRLEYVLAGRFYFTSLAPGDYAFPYPIALYLTSAPFAAWTADPAHHIVLLRAVVTAADTLVGVCLYLLLSRRWRDPLAGAAAAACYPLLPLGARTMAWGNLTNMFGQSVFVAAVALMVMCLGGGGNRRCTLLLTALMITACLSHPSTYAILATLGVFAWALSRRAEDPVVRSASRAVLAATVVATVVAFVLYYAWFLPTYHAASVRIGGELAAAATSPGWRRLWERTSEVPIRVLEHHGLPALVLAALGAWSVWRRPAADPLRLVLGAWFAACAFYLVVGLLTPVDLRYYLADLPAVAILAGVGWSLVWRARPRWRAVLVGLAMWMLWVGVRVRFEVFT